MSETVSKSQFAAKPVDVQSIRWLHRGQLNATLVHSSSLVVGCVGSAWEPVAARVRDRFLWSGRLLGRL